MPSASRIALAALAGSTRRATTSSMSFSKRSSSVTLFSSRRRSRPVAIARTSLRRL
jgi:hypothetical protein